MACILVVEDQSLVLRTIRTLLERAGHVVFGARDGKECEAVLLFARPDVIVMDIVMPRCNGLEAIRAVRRGRHPARILAISGGQLDEEDPLVRAQELGADATLAKPFDRAGLLEALAPLLPKAA